MVNIHGFAQKLNKKFFDLKELAFKDNLEPEIVDKIEKITNQEIPKALDFIFTNVTKMDSILNSLLKISRTGRLKMIIKKIDMDKLITKIFLNHSLFKLKTLIQKLFLINYMIVMVIMIKLISFFQTLLKMR